jgi:hypothetical protein
VRELIRSLEDVETDDPRAVEQAWAAELEERATRALMDGDTQRNSSRRTQHGELDSKLLADRIARLPVD